MDFTVTKIDSNGEHDRAPFSGADKYEIVNGTLTVRTHDPNDADIVTVLQWSPAFWVSVAEAPKKVKKGRVHGV
ncbi:MAG TPA: hypothetical protein VIM10_01535 [Actinopolymorphaceae bacterium]|jgi:hypothetical protein